MEVRLAGQNVRQEDRSLSWGDDPSPLGSSQSMGNFDWEDVRCHEFVGQLPIIAS
jgi:hypothetical protein